MTREKTVPENTSALDTFLLHNYSTWLLRNCSCATSILLYSQWCCVMSENSACRICPEWPSGTGKKDEVWMAALLAFKINPSQQAIGKSRHNTHHQHQKSRAPGIKCHPGKAPFHANRFLNMAVAVRTFYTGAGLQVEPERDKHCHSVYVCMYV